jgi:hypothetical protein
MDDLHPTLSQSRACSGVSSIKITSNHCSKYFFKYFHFNSQNFGNIISLNVSLQNELSKFLILLVLAFCKSHIEVITIHGKPFKVIKRIHSTAQSNGHISQNESDII